MNKEFLDFGIIVFGCLAFFLMLYSKDLLRDEITGDDKTIKKPYSLARVQVALWTIIIGCSYLYIYFCNSLCGENLLILNKTALALLGISIGTAVVAKNIDTTQLNNPNRHQNGGSGGFFLDILSDENGISVHRFQAVLFTVIAVVIYINKVYCMGVLPEFDNTLLRILTANYSGYLGIKLNENKS